MHCLFHGSMTREDKISTHGHVNEKNIFDFSQIPLEDRGPFNYGEVWSGDLTRQVE